MIYHGHYADCLDHVRADLIFTSPPYNIGSKSPRLDGQRRLGKYDPKSYGSITDYPDSMDEELYQQTQVEFLSWCANHLAEDGTVVYNHKPRRKCGRLIHPFQWISKVPRLTLMEEIIWDRGSTHNHCDRLLWPTTERLYVLRAACGQYRFRNVDSLTFRSDVWRLPRALRNGHNAPFPLLLARAVVEAWSAPGDLVCDPYLGSGTSAVAAAALGRRFEGSERLKKYYAIAVRAAA